MTTTKTSTIPGVPAGYEWEWIGYHAGADDSDAGRAPQRTWADVEMADDYADQQYARGYCRGYDA